MESEIDAFKPSSAVKTIDFKNIIDCKRFAKASPTLEAPASKVKVFQIDGSSEKEGSLEPAFISRTHDLLLTLDRQKQLANTVPSTSPFAIDVYKECGYDESGIDVDQEDWEDVNNDNVLSTVDEKELFKRIKPGVNMTSHRSLISLGLASKQQLQNLAPQRNDMAVQSTLSNSQSRANHFDELPAASTRDYSDTISLMMEDEPHGGSRPLDDDAPYSPAEPTSHASNGASQPIALSPRTTRQNMLNHELTESLRRHLLWERSQKNLTANAVFCRRHTFQDMANQRQYQRQTHMKQDINDIDTNSWDQQSIRETFAGYDTKGW